MDGTSLTPQQEKLQALQQLLPEVFAEGKVDWEKLKATLGEDTNFSNERYVLNWAGKSDAFKVLQTPSTKTLIPAPDESVDFDTTQNIFIEGENLDVLKVLQKSYFGKVKMIYIDPPYNTGNDSFIYPDKFSETKAAYEKRVGDKDDEGYVTRDGLFKKNSKENGQYHSNWLNMMMPRLYLAKNLLTQDGVIFISIDDNEVHNLRLLMNEIFGEENFVSELIWHSKYTTSNDAKYVSRQHEYVLMYAKSLENFEIGLLDRTKEMDDSYKNPDNDPKGNWKATPLHAKSGSDNSIYTITFPNNKTWTAPQGRYPRYSQESLMRIYEEGGIYFNKSGGIDRKTYLSEVKQGKTVGSLWSYINVGSSHQSNEELADVLNKGMFDNPKPINLIKTCLKVANTYNDLIIDFFAGSGTTAHAVMELNKEDGGNRKYICVQLSELCDENSEAYKAGYKTIAEISKERIRRAGKKINEELHLKNQKQKQELNFDNQDNQVNQGADTGFKVFKLSESNFKQWQQPESKDAKALAAQMALFIDPVVENAAIENIMYELLLKTGKSLNAKIEKRNGYFIINAGELILLLETATQTIIEQVIAEKPNKVIALDKLFVGNDQLKTNTVLQMKDAGIEFKTL